MRILAFSDIYRWSSSYRRLVERYRPDIVALAGDLTCDGNAYFLTAALEGVPKLKKKIEALKLERLNVVLRENRAALAERYKQGNFEPMIARHGPATKEIENQLRELNERARKAPGYLAAKQRTHIDPFYDFLRYAGRVSTVLVIKGNHDDAFPGDYDPSRIDGIPGCHEISGKAYAFGEWVFLGLGFRQAGYRRVLRPLIAGFAGRVGIVIAHVPEKNLHLVTQLRPKLLIRGHFMEGRAVVDGIPAAFTSGWNALIEMGKTAPPHIRGCGGEPAQGMMHSLGFRVEVAKGRRVLI